MNRTVCSVVLGLVASLLPSAVADGQAVAPPSALVPRTDGTLGRASLAGRSAAAIWRQVHAGLTPRLYTGPALGGEGALTQATGDDVDTALALATRLRSADVPARLVEGTAHLSPAQVELLAGTDDLPDALDVLQAAGKEASLWEEDGRAVGLRVRRTVVEAEVPVAQTLGVDPSSAARATARVRVPLDAALKGVEPVDGTVLSELPVSPASLLLELEAATRPVDPAEGLAGPLGDLLATRLACQSDHTRILLEVLDRPATRALGALRTSLAAQEAAGRLPLRLPYPFTEQTPLDDAELTPVRLAVAVGGGAASLPVPVLDGAGLRLSFAPATEADRARLARRRGRTPLPVQDVWLRPVVTLGGAPVEGFGGLEPVRMGWPLRVAWSLEGAASGARGELGLRAGEPTVLLVDAVDDTGPGLLAARRALAVAQEAPARLPAALEALGRAVHRALDRLQELAAAGGRVRVAREPRLLAVGVGLTLEERAGAPAAATADLVRVVVLHERLHGTGPAERRIPAVAAASLVGALGPGPVAAGVLAEADPGAWIDAGGALVAAVEGGGGVVTVAAGEPLPPALADLPEAAKEAAGALLRGGMDVLVPGAPVVWRGRELAGVLGLDRETGRLERGLVVDGRPGGDTLLAVAPVDAADLVEPVAGGGADALALRIDAGLDGAAEHLDALAVAVLPAAANVAAWLGDVEAGDPLRALSSVALVHTALARRGELPPGVEPECGPTDEVGFDGGPNRRPVFLSDPPLAAREGEAWRYAARVDDADADPLTFSLEVAPAGMEASEYGGLFWVPGERAAGEHRVVLRADDGRGGVVRQAFSVVVEAVNRAPRIVSLPGSTVAERGLEWRYEPVAEDVDGDAPAWRLVDGPAGMELDEGAGLRWTPDPDAAGLEGHHAVELEAADPGGATATQRFHLVVPAAGDEEPPEVAIDTPADLASLSDVTLVGGTAWDVNLTEWVLEACGRGKAAMCREVARGTSPVRDGELGVLDPQPLPDGRVHLRLTATDAFGRSRTVESRLEVEGGNHPGVLRLGFSDIVARLTAIGVELRREYDTRRRGAGDFGVGWTLSFNTVRSEETKPPGEGWQLLISGFDWWLQRADAEPEVELVLDDGRTYTFAAVASLAGPFSRLAVVEYLPLDGSRAELYPLRADGTPYDSELMVVGGELRDVFGGNAELFRPEAYILETGYGDERYVVRRDSGGVTAYTDPVGLGYEIREDGLIGPQGTILAFERDPDSGFVTRVRDPRAGREVVYDYDGRDDLVRVVLPDGGEQTFEYDRQHRIVRYTLPEGGRGNAYEYDAKDRVIRHTDPTGVVTENEYDDARATVTQVAGDGGRWVTEYDPAGSVVRETDPLGLTRETDYDARGRTIRVRRKGGEEYRLEYEGRLRTPVRVTDPLGHSKTATYDTAGRLTAYADEEGRTWRLVWGNAGELTRAVAPDGRTLFELGYDGDGHLVREVDGAGRTTLWERDAYGRPVVEVEPDGGVATTEYDPTGLVGTVTQADGSTQVVHRSLRDQYTGVDLPGGVALRTTHTGDGGPSVVESPAGTTRFVRDASGRLVRLEVDGRPAQELTYDTAGRLRTWRRADGTLLRYDRAANGVATAVHGPDGTTEYEHDPGTGRLFGVRWPDGAQRRVEYDAAGQMTAVEDGRGRRVELAYDRSGLPVRRTDDAGRVAEVRRDALGLPVEFVGNGGLTVRREFEVTGVALEPRPDLPVVRRTDPSGAIWEYERDSEGRPVRIVDPAGGVTEVAQSEDGRPEVVTAANGARWLLGYEDGQLRWLEDPAGLRTAWTHDALGRVRSRTAPDGTALSYEYEGGVTTTRGSDGSESVEEVGPKGLVTRTSSADATVAYGYDDRGRPIEVRTEDGATASLGYTASGRLASVGVQVLGGELLRTSYRYDVDGRLVGLTGPGGEETEYRYDAAGRLTEERRGNGTTTTYEWAACGRPAAIRHVSEAGGELGEWRYEYDEACRRVREETPHGVLAYGYDLLDRLVRVAGLDEHGEETEVETHEYDALGNLTVRRTAAGATTWEHGLDGRLLSADGPEGAATWSYDGRGNLVEEQREMDGQVRTTRFDYDLHDRLREVTLPDGRWVQYGYDAQGRLVSRATADEAWRCLPLPAGPRGLTDCAAFYTPGAPERAVVMVYDTVSPVQQVEGGRTRYLHRADLRSVVGASDEAGRFPGGAVGYGPFGGRDGGADLGTDYGFTGEWTDPLTGLVYLRARFYDPGLRRFLTADRANVPLEDPRELNRYAYALSDPLNRTDPHGTMTITEVNFSGAIQQTIKTTARRGARRILNCMFKRGLLRAVGRGLAEQMVRLMFEQIFSSFEPASKVMRIVELARLGGRRKEESLDYFLRYSLCSMFGGMGSLPTGTAGAVVEFQQPVNECGHSRWPGKKGDGTQKTHAASQETCHKWALNGGVGFQGIDIVFMGVLPMEVKIKSSNFGEGQLVRYCRWAVIRHSHTVVYLWRHLPLRTTYAKAARKCWRCWDKSLYPTYSASFCGHSHARMGSILVMVGVYWNRRPVVYIPNILRCNLLKK